MICLTLNQDHHTIPPRHPPAGRISAAYPQIIKGDPQRSGAGDPWSIRIIVPYGTRLLLLGQDIICRISPGIHICRR